MDCVLLSKRLIKRRRRKSKKYGRGKPYIKNNKIYFVGGRTIIIRVKGFLSPLVGIIGNIAKEVLGI